ASAGQFAAEIDWGDGTQSEGWVRAASEDSKLVYNVIGDHTYQREGPYMATVFLQDTKNHVGGIAGTLSVVVNVTSEENIERLNTDAKMTVSSAATDAVQIHVNMDRNTGTYTVFGSGEGQYGYEFSLDSAGGNGNGGSSTNEQGHGGKVHIDH